MIYNNNDNNNNNNNFNYYNNNNNNDNNNNNNNNNNNYTLDGHSCEILPEDYPKSDYSFKIILIGRCGVGKTSITFKAVKNIFNSNYKPTIGFDFCTFVVKIDEIIIKLQIWDTCGQELYRGLITNFYRNSSLAIIVYSIVDRESFNEIESWVKELKFNNKPDSKTFLIGNKNDLEIERKVLFKEGEEIKNFYGFDFFNEISAKNEKNTKELFIKAALLLFEDYEKYMKFKNNNNKNGSKFSLNSSSLHSYYSKSNKKMKSKKCC